MKLSKDSLNLIKNFAGINSNILLKSGSKLTTISSQKNVMASCSLGEIFPSDFGIYDLNEFLGALSLFEDPDLVFTEKYVTIKDGKHSIKYYACSKETLTIPQKDIIFPDAEIDFSINENTLALINRTASVLHAPDLSLIGDGTKIIALVGDKKNATSNSYEVAVGETAQTFRINLKIENLKMLPGCYTVAISSKKISRFEGLKSELTYFVAVEADSTFG